VIAVIDSGVANLRSVANALRYLNAPAHIISAPADLAKANKVILPGVGAFSAGMDTLRKNGFVKPIQEMAASGVPILGICLGMQLLFDQSEEMGLYDGLGLIKGRIIRFPESPSYKVPHMGWNKLEHSGRSPLLHGVKADGYAYFVHSYYASTAPEHVIASCEYGITFPAVVASGNIYGAQFHPEKSQHTGLTLLKNFMDM
jgi:imidazole glycerol-phosphate synthase subunit HisH